MQSYEDKCRKLHPIFAGFVDPLKYNDTSNFGVYNELSISCYKSTNPDMPKVCAGLRRFFSDKPFQNVQDVKALTKMFIIKTDVRDFRRESFQKQYDEIMKTLEFAYYVPTIFTTVDQCISQAMLVESIKMGWTLVFLNEVVFGVTPLPAFLAVKIMKQYKNKFAEPISFSWTPHG